MCLIFSLNFPGRRACCVLSSSLTGSLLQLVKAVCEQSSLLFLLLFSQEGAAEEHRTAILQTHRRDRVMFIEIFFLEED